MGLIKPAPAYFHYVLDGLQTEPKDCVFIADKPKVDAYTNDFDNSQ